MFNQQSKTQKSSTYYDVWLIKASVKQKMFNVQQMTKIIKILKVADEFSVSQLYQLKIHLQLNLASSRPIPNFYLEINQH